MFARRASAMAVTYFAHTAVLTRGVADSPPPFGYGSRDADYDDV